MTEFNCFRIFRTVAMMVGLPVVAGSAFAQAPALTTTAPLGGRPGETVDVTCQGGNLAGATGLWTTFADMAGLAPDIENNGQDAAKVVFRLAIPADAPLGIHGVRVLSPGGVSSLRLFVVDDLPTVAEAGGNNQREAAQALTLPCAVDGRVDNLTRDFYSFEAAAGQQLSFEVLARRLGSPLDPSIYLYRADGRELAYNDDAEGLSSDCQLAYTFDEAGAYVLEVRDIQYAGGGTHVYRLRIGDFPCVNVPVPIGVQRGAGSRIDFAGVSTADAAPDWVEVPADAHAGWTYVSTRRPGGASSAFAEVQISDHDEYLEREPNDTGEQANRVTLGAQINGRFEHPGDIDRYTFSAKQGQRFEFAGIARQVGAPTDLMLKLFDATGKQLAAVDDSGTSEGSFNVTFPADGEYTLTAQDLLRRGGSQYAYRVAVRPYQAGFTLTASADSLNVPAGGVAVLTVTSARRDYNGKIDVAINGLPEGLTSVPTTIGPGMNQVVLTVQAAPDAAPASLANVAVTGAARIGDADVTATASLEAALRGQLSNTVLVPGTLQSTIAAAVAPAGKLALRTEPARIVFGPELKATVKIIAERGEGIDEAIQLAITPEKGGVPGNVNVEVKPIDKGSNEVEIALSGTDKAPLGQFTIVLLATHTKDNQTVTAYTPGIAVDIAPPMTVSTELPEPNLTRGGTTTLNVTVNRNPALSGEVKLTLDKLPAGVTAPETVLPADQSQVSITLTATADAVQGDAGEIVVNAVATANEKLTASAKVPTLKVQ